MLNFTSTVPDLETCYMLILLLYSLKCLRNRINMVNVYLHIMTNTGRKFNTNPPNHLPVNRVQRPLQIQTEVYIFINVTVCPQALT